MKKIILILIFCISAPLAAQVNQEWVKTYSFMSGGADFARGMTIDGSNNIYVSGLSESNTEYDFCTIKYNINGSQQWLKRHSGIYDDVVTDMTHDYDNNIYIAGYRKLDTVTGYDACIIKYNSSGVQQWIAPYVGPGKKKDFVNSIHVDNAKNVYIAGGTEDNETYSKLLVAKYSPTGVLLWKHVLGNLQNRDVAEDIVTDGFGNVYAAGTYDDIAYLFKFSPSGQIEWQKAFVSADPGVYIRIKLDLSSNIIVAGSVGINAVKNFLIAKYDTDGQQIWVKLHNGSQGKQDDLNSLTVDYSNNVYVTGSCNVGTTSGECVTIKYSSTGSKLWETAYNGTGTSHDEGHDVTFDGQGNVYVTGATHFPWNNRACMTIKYNSAGVQQWVTKYFGPDSSDYGKFIKLDHLNNIIVCGQSNINNTPNFMTIKYTSITGMQILGGETPMKYNLSQNYPNPFNPVTNINFSLPKSGYVKLIVYDIMGKEAASLVDEELQAGSYKFDFDAAKLSSGTYFYRLTAGDFTEVKKMILIK